MRRVTVDRTSEDGVTLVRLTDPAAQNRLSEALCEDLLQALEAAARDKDLRVLVLAGSRETFCAGADLETLRQLSRGERAVKDMALPDRLLAFPLPIVAALEGHAVGGGLALALCCDVLVAARSARYGVNFTDLGFPPGMGTMALLPAKVGHHFAAEMILTARFWRGHELEGRGLFNHVEEADRVLEVALQVAGRMADKPRHVLELVKAALALPRRQALLAASAREHLMHDLCFERPETLARIESNYLSEDKQEG